MQRKEQDSLDVVCKRAMETIRLSTLTRAQALHIREIYQHEHAPRRLADDDSRGRQPLFDSRHY